MVKFDIVLVTVSWWPTADGLQDCLLVSIISAGVMRYPVNRREPPKYFPEHIQCKLKTTQDHNWTVLSLFLFCATACLRFLASQPWANLAQLLKVADLLKHNFLWAISKSFHCSSIVLTPSFNFFSGQQRKIPKCVLLPITLSSLSICSAKKTPFYFVHNMLFISIYSLLRSHFGHHMEEISSCWYISSIWAEYLALTKCRFTWKSVLARQGNNVDWRHW